MHTVSVAGPGKGLKRKNRPRHAGAARARFSGESARGGAHSQSTSLHDASPRAGARTFSILPSLVCCARCLQGQVGIQTAAGFLAAVQKVREILSPSKVSEDGGELIVDPE